MTMNMTMRALRKPFTGHITLAQGKTECLFLPSGDIYALLHDGLLINGFQGSPSAGSINQIYLRVQGVGTAPLLGRAASGSVSADEHSISQTGTALGVEYAVTFHLLSEFIWVWEVRLKGHATCDLIYGQDLGMGDIGGVLTNELYSAQYLGHTPLTGEHGFAVCSRQAMPQSGGRCPYIQQGMLIGEAVAYSTDGCDFFGLEYKRSNHPLALQNGLTSRNYQYEFSYTALQTNSVELDGEVCFAFYALIRQDHPEAVRELAYQDELVAAAALLGEAKPDATPISSMRESCHFGEPYASPAMSEDEISRRFVDRRVEERVGGQLYSFFTGHHTHVVTQAKELACERPHGTILMNAVPEAEPRSDIFAVTNYIYGLFGAQIVLGNTTWHKAVSAARGMLNVQKHGGIRLYVRVGGVYRLLTLPAVYQMAADRSTWTYIMPDGDVLTIDTRVASNAPKWQLTATSERGKPYAFIVSAQLAMGENEWMGEIEVQADSVGIQTRFGPNTRAASPYPDLTFAWSFVGGECAISDDRIFFDDGAPRDETLLTCTMEPTDTFTLSIRGSLDGTFDASESSSDDNDGDMVQVLRRETRGLALRHDDQGVMRVRDMIPWYVHNALIHFASPHGLEQPGGAAWGTRDVCQGPFEMMRAFGSFDRARNTLLRVYAHQWHRDGLWPQWFMFDRYDVCAGDCHGDVFLWPLKIVADYLLDTADYAVLDERIPYAEGGECEPLIDHVRRAVDHFHERLLPGTALLSYAGGDWDDTLQPARAEMRENLVSSWTQALGYEVASTLSQALMPAVPDLANALSDLAMHLCEDFNKHLIIDGQIAGFALAENEGFEPMLHEHDHLTGLRCRLIPQTRSILSGLVDEQQARRNLDFIDTYLRCPDGVRLMDHPAPYAGGVSTLFKRAEQAANVGREIGLQYVHAHIRYIEALAVLGDAEKAWDALLTIVPPGLSETVKNALPRQSNLYFSSSDGAFTDRYAFAEGYDRLRTGDVPVKGGWRLYSSGSGICLRTIIASLLGLRLRPHALIIDPVLPESLDGLEVDMECFGKVWTFRYHAGKAPVQCAGVPISGIEQSNRYRPAGILIEETALNALPDQTIDVYIGK